MLIRFKYSSMVIKWLCSWTLRLVSLLHVCIAHFIQFRGNHCKICKTLSCGTYDVNCIHNPHCSFKLHDFLLDCCVHFRFHPLHSRYIKGHVCSILVFCYSVMAANCRWLWTLYCNISIPQPNVHSICILYDKLLPGANDDMDITDMWHI